MSRHPKNANQTGSSISFELTRQVWRGCFAGDHVTFFKKIIFSMFVGMFTHYHVPKHVPQWDPAHSSQYSERAKNVCPDSSTHTGTNPQQHWDEPSGPSLSVGSLSVSLHNTVKSRRGPLWSCAGARPRPPPHQPREFSDGGAEVVPAVGRSGSESRSSDPSVCSAPCRWSIYQPR